MDRLDELIQDVEDARVALEEAEESGDLEARLEAANDVADAERRLLKARIDYPFS